MNSGPSSECWGEPRNTRALISQLYRRLNPSDAEVEALKKEIDEDDSGDIDFQEFCEVCVLHISQNECKLCSVG